MLSVTRPAGTLGRRTILAATAVLSCIAGGVLWRKPRAFFDPSRVYTIGYTHNPPYQIHTPGEVPRGIAVDTVSAAARCAGIRLQWVFDPGKSPDPILNGVVDLWPLLTNTPSRRARVYFSDPWMVSENYLISHGEETALPPDSYRGPIAYAGPSVYTEVIRRLWPAAEAREVASTQTLLDALCNESAPFAYGSSHQTNELMREMLVRCPTQQFRAHHLTTVTTRLSIAARKGLARPTGCGRKSYT